MFFVAGLFMALVTGVNAVLAYRLRPIYRPVRHASGQGVDAYRMAIDPHRRLLLGIALGLVGLISGHHRRRAPGAPGCCSSTRSRSASKIPQFHLDISFFVFTYPFIRMVLSYLFAAVLLSLVAGRAGARTCTAGCGCRAGAPG